MSIAEVFLMELDHEAVSTRKMLERLPQQHLGWKPHPKSFTLGQLASHLAEILGWTKETMELNELALDNFKSFQASTNSEIIAKFDASVAMARKALAGKSDEHMMQIWTMKMDGRTMLSMPRVAVMRNMIMNHLIHHRAQLGVYLRMQDVPLPAVYGPSADERP